MDAAGTPANDGGLGSGQIGGIAMLGPLPRLYRSYVVAAVLVLGIAAGAWTAHVTALPLAATVGAMFGAAVAALIAFLMVHDFSPRARRARIPRRP